MASGDTSSGIYDPQCANPNFVIPSKSVLQKVNIGFTESDMKPGPSYNMIKAIASSTTNSKTYNLSVDGKNTNSCTSSLAGAVDCFGYEPERKKQDIEYRRDDERALLQELQDASKELDAKHKQNLEEIAQNEREIIISKLKPMHMVFSYRIKEIRVFCL